MIPRPLTDDAARHDPGRWICSKRPERCSGVFRVYGQDMACPIRAKCWLGRRNTCEHTPGPRLHGRFPALDVDVGRRKEHSRRLAELIRLWGDRPRPERTPEQRERNAARMRERRAAERADKPPPPERPPGRPLLLCGEDCEGGCPYEECPYTDADLEALEAGAERERLRQQSRDKYRRQRAREAVDPAYKADRAAKQAVRQKRYYEAHKDVLRAKARERMKKEKGGIQK